jgi:hypothetical protein
MCHRASWEGRGTTDWRPGPHPSAAAEVGLGRLRQARGHRPAEPHSSTDGSGTVPYLTVDIEHVRLAWEVAARAPQDWPEPVLTVSGQLDYGRKAITIHLPQAWPHGIICRNCHATYPCRIVLWGMHLMRERGWTLADAVDLIEAMQAGEPA